MLRTRILLVDDETEFTDSMSQLLRTRGYQVTAVNSGHDALKALKEGKYDVVVLDLKMEDMDGIEVLKVIKRMVPDLPVILLTGHGSQTAAKEGILAGAFDFLTKPCELVELMEKIKEAHEHHKKHAENFNLIDVDTDSSSKT